MAEVSGWCDLLGDERVQALRLGPPADVHCPNAGARAIVVLQDIGADHAAHGLLTASVAAGTAPDATAGALAELQLALQAVEVEGAQRGTEATEATEATPPPCSARKVVAGFGLYSDLQDGSPCPALGRLLSCLEAEAVDTAVGMLRCGEAMVLVLSPGGGQGLAVLAVLLKSFTQAPPPRELDCEGREAHARRWKEAGTHYFKAKESRLAARCYGRATQMLQLSGFLEPEAEPSAAATALLDACLLNLAACHQRQAEVPGIAKRDRRVHSDNAIFCCDQVLERAKSVKALYRRACALAAQHHYTAAHHDLAQALRLDPSSKAVRQKRAQLLRAEHAHTASFASPLAAMFS